MMMQIISFRNVSVMLLLTAALACSAWSIFLTQATSDTVSPAVSTQPDAFMKQVVAIMLSRSGAPTLRVESPSMTHYTDNDSTQIETPHVVIYRESSQPWQVDAKHAVATHGLNTIHFSEHVVLHHPNDSDTTDTTLLTEGLTVFPDTEKAETDLPVTITQPNAMMQGIGMLSDLKEGTIRLLTQIRGQYVPDA